MKRQVIFLLALAVLCFIQLAGNSSSIHAQTTTKAPDREWDGTYQFIMKTKMQVVFTTDIIDFIEKNRKDDQDVIINYSEFVDIYIVSRKKINSSDFKPFSEAYVFSN